MEPRIGLRFGQSGRGQRGCPVDRRRRQRLAEQRRAAVDQLDLCLHNFDVMEALQLERPYVVGESMGGWMAAEMAALAAFFRQNGLFTFVRWNYFFTNPPLCITEAELREGFAIIDRGLAITDSAVK